MRSIEVARLETLPEGKGLAVAIGDHPLALFRAGDAIVALDGACIRCTALVAAGRFDGHEVTCPGCGWRYAVSTGHVAGLSRLRLDTYEATVVGGAICVSVPFD